MTEPRGDGILVLRALGVGDLVTGLPALRALRRAFGGERIVLAAPAVLAPLVALIDAVDELLPTEGLGQLDWHPPPPRLAVNLHGSGPESIFDVLSAGPDEVITHRHPDFPGVQGTEWRTHQHDVDRWCRLLEDHGIRTDRTDLWLPPPAEPSVAPGAVVVHPGASSPARRWPAERFAQVAGELSAAGHQVVVTGSGSEFDLAADVARAGHLSAASVLAGHTDLAGLAALVADARLVVCPDTGVGHLATAYGTPSVLLFGPTPPDEWGPPEDAKQHVVLWAGERGDPFSDQPSPGLLRLRAEDVVEAASRLLSRSGV